MAEPIVEEVMQEINGWNLADGNAVSRLQSS